MNYRSLLKAFYRGTVEKTLLTEFRELQDRAVNALDSRDYELLEYVAHTSLFTGEGLTDAIECVGETRKYARFRQLVESMLELHRQFINL